MTKKSNYRSKSKRVIDLGLLGMSTAILLSGCANILPLPDEERYRYIHEVRDALDVSSVGTILSEEYDKGDGVFSASFVEITAEGGKIYLILQERLTSLKNVDCQTISDFETRCYLNRINIDLLQDIDNENEVFLKLSDSAGGKR